jgi:hypothetical protein
MPAGQEGRGGVRRGGHGACGAELVARARDRADLAKRR